LEKPSNPSEASGPAWLKHAVFYQVYPQSFFDSNADGIGDLPGITAKLDYIKHLGCNVIWINPCFDSPFGDAGYDIRDFYRVAPRYGTNDDLKVLFAEAHRRDLRVVLDLVAGHTSIEHAWFQASASPIPNGFSNRYVWTDNAWRGPGEGLEGIRGYSDRDGQYVTNFFHFQPALNYGFAEPDPEKPWQLPANHPDAVATREELLRILLHWFGQGADGFRVDMAFSLIKNDPGGKATAALWQEIRRRVAERFPDAALLAEWSIPSQAIPAGFHVDFMIHFGTPAYTSLLRAEPERDVFGMAADEGHSYLSAEGKGDLDAFLKIFLAEHACIRDRGYISVPTGNHDISRIRQGRSVEELKVAYVLLFTLPGLPCIYYGDEIGMNQVAGLASKEGGYGRTGARTPMQWNDEKNAGFSSAPAERLYLPIDPAEDRPTVTAQEDDPDSLLNFTRSLLALRRRLPVLGPDAGFQPLSTGERGYPFVFLRVLGEEKCLIVVNPGAEPAETVMEESFTSPALLLGEPASIKISHERNQTRLQCEGFSFGIYRLQGQSSAWKPARESEMPRRPVNA
jgi:glycosidase